MRLDLHFQIRIYAKYMQWDAALISLNLLSWPWYKVLKDNDEKSYLHLEINEQTTCIFTMWDILPLLIMNQKSALLLNSNITANRSYKLFLNFITSRGQWKFINLLIQMNCKGELGFLFKTSTESSYICSPVLKWSSFANKHIFSACSSPLKTLHDIVHRESENKYSLVSCNLR